MSDKIHPRHLARKAILYVRQSSSYQVANNEESRRLQYAMRERLEQLGWEQIEVIDEDLGRSAAGNVERRGFERMVAEVCLGKVGAVAAREVSRFARNSREWQRLVEVCRVVDTLLIDHEVVYAPRQSNDRQGCQKVCVNGQSGVNNLTSERNLNYVRSTQTEDTRIRPATHQPTALRSQDRWGD